jgi:hypothetical protein
MGAVQACGRTRVLAIDFHLGFTGLVQSSSFVLHSKTRVHGRRRWNQCYAVDGPLVGHGVCRNLGTCRPENLQGQKCQERRSL